MHLYLINIALLLCLPALLCASQEIVEVDSTPGLLAITNYNESYPPTRRLSSRTNGKIGSPAADSPGPVQAAFKGLGSFLGLGSFGTVYDIEDGFLVDDKKVRAVMKLIWVYTQTDLDWIMLELVYLETVGQLLAHGKAQIMTRRSNRERYCIVMPYMGMTAEKARAQGLKKDKIPELTKGLVDDYEDRFKVRYLDLIEPNTVFELVASEGWKAYLTSGYWKAHLIDWGYAKFTSQPNPPRPQQFSPECSVPHERCVYYAVTHNLGKPVGRFGRFSMHNRLTKDFGGFPATVREMTVRNTQDYRTIHHEAMGQIGVDQFIAWAVLDHTKGQVSADGTFRVDFYLVTKYMGDPVKPNQFSVSKQSDLRQEARKRYQKAFGLIHPFDREDDYVYRLVKGSKTEFEANIIDNWAFALPPHADPGKPEIFKISLE